MLSATLSENLTGLVENFVQPQWESNLRPQDCSLLFLLCSVFCSFVFMVSRISDSRRQRVKAAHKKIPRINDLSS